MFFSTELLSQKSSPFSRLWFLGCDLKKIENADLKCKVIKLSKEVQKWIQRQDMQALSLPLSATLLYGISRIVERQTHKIFLRASNLSINLMREIRLAKSLNQIDLDAKESAKAVLDFDVLPPTTENDMGELTFGNFNAPTEAITLREPDLANPVGTLDEDETFGDVVGQPIAGTLFDDEEEDWTRWLREKNVENPVETAENPDDFLQPVNPADFESTEMNQVEPGVDTNAPPRSSGPQNGCREHPPPQFDEHPLVEEQNPLAMEVDQETIEEVQATPQDHEQASILPEGIPIEVGDAEDQSPMELPPPPVVEPPNPNRRRRGIKRKLKIDKKMQFSKETRIDWMENYEDIMRPADKAQPSWRPAKWLLGHFPRQPMFDNLVAELEEAANWNQAQIEHEQEEVVEVDQSQVESLIREQSTNRWSSRIQENEETTASHELVLSKNTTADNVVAPLVLDTSENDINVDLNEIPPQMAINLEENPEPGLNLSRIEEVTEEATPVEEEIPSRQVVINDEDIIGSLNDEEPENMRDIFKKKNWSLRLEVAKAFEKMLHLEKAGKITCLQTEYCGNILVKKN